MLPFTCERFEKTGIIAHLGILGELLGNKTSKNPNCEKIKGIKLLETQLKIKFVQQNT